MVAFIFIDVRAAPLVWKSGSSCAPRRASADARFHRACQRLVLDSSARSRRWCTSISGSFNRSLIGTPDARQRNNAGHRCKVPEHFAPICERHECPAVLGGRFNRANSKIFISYRRDDDPVNRDNCDLRHLGGTGGAGRGKPDKKYWKSSGNSD
jgi:hypothetical protein